MINYFGTFAGDFENIKEQSTMQNEHFIQNQIIKYFPMTSSILKQIYLIYLK